MKTLTIIAGLTIMVAAITNRVSVSTTSRSEFATVGRTQQVDKGCYLASDFAKFKKENLHDDMSVAVDVSDKVLFKAFVKSKQSAE